LRLITVGTRNGVEVLMAPSMPANVAPATPPANARFPQRRVAAGLRMIALRRGNQLREAPAAWSFNAA